MDETAVIVFPLTHVVPFFSASLKLLLLEATHADPICDDGEEDMRFVAPGSMRGKSSLGA